MTVRLNTKVFDTWNEYSSYILGYFYADASVYVTENGRAELTISGQDKELLQQILKLLGSEHEIVEINNSYRVRICNKGLVDKLVEKGLNGNKRETLRFPRGIPKDMMRHFIRGYFDGKGSWMSEKERRLVTNFSGINAWFVEGLRDELVLQGLSRANIHHGGNKKASNYIRYYIEDSKKLYSLMYYNARIYSRTKRSKYDAGV